MIFTVDIQQIIHRKKRSLLEFSIRDSQAIGKRVKSTTNKSIIMLKFKLPPLVKYMPEQTTPK